MLNCPKLKLPSNDQPPPEEGAEPVSAVHDVPSNAGGTLPPLVSMFRKARTVQSVLISRVYQYHVYGSAMVASPLL